MFAFQAKEITEVAVKGGLSILEAGVLGALLILSVALNILLVVKLLKVQDVRVSDREADTVRLEKVNERMERMAASTNNAITGMASAVEGLESVAKSTNTTLQAMQRSMDTVVGQALTTIQQTASARRSPYSPPHGIPNPRGR